MLSWNSLSPVSVAYPLELIRYEAGEQRSHSAAFDGLLGQPSQPHVDVLRSPVQLQEPLRQFLVFQHFTQLLHILGLGQTTELPPLVVS